MKIKNLEMNLVFLEQVYMKTINTGLGELCGIISLTTKRIYNDNDNNIKNTIFVRK